MNYIEKLYGKKYLEKQKQLFSKRLNKLPNFLISDLEEDRIYQIEFNKYLELVYRHKIMNTLKNRLLSNNLEIFFQAHRELMCAYFFEKILHHKISFYPKGAKGYKGDILLELSGNDCVFVEVKSPIRRAPKQPWFSNDSGVIKRILKKAREKMSSIEKNMMILAGDLKVPIKFDKATGLLSALYGDDIVTFAINSNGHPIEEPRLSFKPSGMFQPTKNTRISTVAIIYDECPNDHIEYIFKVYHNPYAKNPIDVNLFKGWPQFVPNRETNRMEWIDK